MPGSNDYRHSVGIFMDGFWTVLDESTENLTVNVLQNPVVTLFKCPEPVLFTLVQYGVYYSP